jgi:hypothetical protein
MKGINEKVAVTQQEKLLNCYGIELKQVISVIVGKFIEMLKKN